VSPDTDGGIGNDYGIVTLNDRAQVSRNTGPGILNAASLDCCPTGGILTLNGSSSVSGNTDRGIYNLELACWGPKRFEKCGPECGDGRHHSQER
jgi:hypothetical protein